MKDIRNIRLSCDTDMEKGKYLVTMSTEDYALYLFNMDDEYKKTAAFKADNDVRFNS